MSDAELRIDPLTGAYVVVTPWRQRRPNVPDGPCPFCPGGLEAPEPYDVRHSASALASAELGAGVFFDPVDPHQAAERWRSPPERP